MNIMRKAYVSPRLVRVKLEPSQAILSQCSVGVTDIRRNEAGGCKSGRNCRSDEDGDSAATS